MPHNECCPACGRLVPDWHWEWHQDPDFSAIYHGAAGMDCPYCGAVVIYARTTVPLHQPPPGSQVVRVKRDAAKAAVWARVSNAGMSLEDYLGTAEGQPYSNYWTRGEVHQADQQAAANP
jgi:hypothetical protein